MANAIYPLYKEKLISGGSNVDLIAGTAKVSLIDTGTVAYSSAHDFWDDVSAAEVGTGQTLGTKSATNGTFDAANAVFSTVSGATVEAIIIWIDTTVATTSPLACYMDTGITGLPVTPNGGDINLNFDAGGIFTL